MIKLILSDNTTMCVCAIILVVFIYCIAQTWKIYTLGTKIKRMMLENAALDRKGKTIEQIEQAKNSEEDYNNLLVNKESPKFTFLKEKEDFFKKHEKEF